MRRFQLMRVAYWSKLRRSQRSSSREFILPLRRVPRVPPGARRALTPDKAEIASVTPASEIKKPKIPIGVVLVMSPAKIVKMPIIVRDTPRRILLRPGYRRVPVSVDTRWGSSAERASSIWARSLRSCSERDTSDSILSPKS